MALLGVSLGSLPARVPDIPFIERGRTAGPWPLARITGEATIESDGASHGPTIGRVKTLAAASDCLEELDGLFAPGSPLPGDRLADSPQAQREEKCCRSNI
jgi:hypothetical protein